MREVENPQIWSKTFKSNCTPRHFCVPPKQIHGNAYQHIHCSQQSSEILRMAPSSFPPLHPVLTYQSAIGLPINYEKLKRHLQCLADINQPFHHQFHGDVIEEAGRQWWWRSVWAGGGIFHRQWLFDSRRWRWNNHPANTIAQFCALNCEDAHMHTVSSCSLLGKDHTQLP